MDETLKQLWDDLEYSYNYRANLEKLREDTFNHLGGCTCNHCGSTDIRVLTVDHIHDDGAEERLNMGTYTTYRNILKMTEIEAQGRYQVLCRNCNWLKEIERKDRALENKRDAIRKQIREHKDMVEHYRRLDLPFGLDL